MSDLNPTKTLPAIRLAIGAGSWAAPAQTGTLFGINLKDNHEAVFLGRLFGIRDIALAAGVLAGSPESRKLWWQLGVVCDLADAAAGVLAFRAGVTKRGSIMATLTALSAAGMGIAVLAAGDGGE